MIGRHNMFVALIDAKGVANDGHPTNRLLRFRVYISSGSIVFFTQDIFGLSQALLLASFWIVSIVSGCDFRPCVCELADCYAIFFVSWAFLARISISGGAMASFLCTVNGACDLF